MDIRRISFRGGSNAAGSIAFVEGESEVPFTIHRIYYIYGVPAGARRGFHAHKKLKQVLFCVNGACRLLLDDGRERAEVLLDKPDEGIVISRPIWREMYDFTPGAVLMVLASEHYDPADYIRDYDAFIDYAKTLEERS